MNNRSKTDLTERAKRVNWIGVAAGVLMLILPFLPWAWWSASVGSGAANVGISPFHVTISGFGEEFSLPIIRYAVLGSKLVVLAGGMLMIVGSIMTERSWSKSLIKFGSTKVLWAILGLVASVLVLSVIGNNFLDLGLPYLFGSETISFSGEVGPLEMPEGVSISLPMTMGFSRGFLLALFTAGLAIAARIFNERFTSSGT
ncbi:hypothetical protein AKJ45_01470 [candidate division MSBL1 archaeon SCGC-AAA261F19]|uniref:Uncharacterized protein n=1 Tax=candidate division MSBL1 archaeon SCGC-AAA261F19 TaxID=1698275 RepID=A0A133VAN1_9EURY|nr:hypothetical protein AKJ45_01470 [candidate division MSBL1 archaeon SCGC-AAA261F19]